MTSDRRTFLGAGLGVAAAATSQSWDFTAGAAEMPSREGNRAEASTDFGRLIHREPRAVAQPISSAEVASLLRLARAERLKVAARGQGHSIYGRSLSENGIVIDMGRLNSIRDLRPDRVVVDAGATWKSVLDATLPQGLTPPVLTNYLGLSVGGTIAVGGIGGSSSRYGMQTDNVLELDVVTGDGHELTCSVGSNPNAFDAVRAGLGQCGIITRATLRLVRAPERVRRFQLFYPGLSELIADQRRALAEERFDQLQGAILPDGAGGWRYQLEGAVFYNGNRLPDDSALLKALSDTRSAAVITDLTYGEDAAAFAKFEALLRSKGQWTTPKPWLLAFLPGSNAEQLAREILDELTPADIGPFGRITCYPMMTNACRTPLVRLPAESVVFPFNVIRVPPSDDRAAIERMVAQNRALYDRLRRAGAMHYPVSAFPMSQDDWKDHFGSSWARFAEIKRRLDPADLLTPGYAIF
ncbi:FAD-binding protein [Bradyrhizobium sp. WSM 1738]|uniref:FAD-binding protein n=1 Tax=Bradyrhizobium hereditatis TaxID=2821405 RepID=UPI001CE284A9|nr:FAD-binding protein [Bradyrhizobium hereditatis]MCA6116589.1 FAD-binding protein [Bradyrhizobium hereditatis]